MDLNNLNFKDFLLQHRHFLLIICGAWLAVALTSCNTVITSQYEATVQTTLTWQVKYYINPTNNKIPRFEEFASSSLLTRNGEQPKQRLIGPDEKGLWWPILPPRPTIDQVEQRMQSQEQASPPELLQREKYEIIYQQDGQTLTMPTDYDVYRQVVRAYRTKKPLRLTLGINNSSVTKAELAN